MNFLALPRQSRPPAGTFTFPLSGTGGVPDRTGFPITFRLGEPQHLAVRMDLGTSCACGPKRMARCYRSQLFLSSLVLEARTARWVLDAVHALLSLRTQGNTSSPQPAWIVQIGSFDAPRRLIFQSCSPWIKQSSGHLLRCARTGRQCYPAGKRPMDLSSGRGKPPQEKPNAFSVTGILQPRSLQMDHRT